MRVVVSDEAREYLEGHGGVIFVSPHPHRCCSGTITLLDTSTDVSDDAAFESVSGDGIDVRFRGGAGRPDLLEIQLRGVLRRHLVAYWDGCAIRP